MWRSDRLIRWAPAVLAGVAAITSLAAGLRSEAVVGGLSLAAVFFCLAAVLGRFALRWSTTARRQGGASTEYRLFVSYSREDRAIVGPLVSFLRVADQQIFRDMDSIPPGDRWRAVLARTIDRCETVLVFWCRHASESACVREEYTRAIGRQKKLVPVLLDDSRLPSELAQFQAIDLRYVLPIHEADPAIFGQLADGQRAEVRSDPSKVRLIVPKRAQLASVSEQLYKALHPVLRTVQRRLD